jgi:hypothetical protein
MVSVGTPRAEEAREVIELSLDIFNKRATTVEMQETRSKSTRS